jgi:hypothetical protein
MLIKDSTTESEAPYDFLQAAGSNTHMAPRVPHDVLEDLRNRTEVAAEVHRTELAEAELDYNGATNTASSQGSASTARITKGPVYNSKPTGKPAALNTKRFWMLPNEKRPEPAISTPERVPEEDEVWNFTAPAPLQPPAIDRYLFSIPKATLVPSYVLASSNRFTKSEIAPSLSSSVSRATPLLVYGRFMFPSILRAQARKSLSSVYSPLHQRRLHPNTRDWAQVDKSLKHAAEAMTPALLRGYDRWKPDRMSCAAIQNSRLRLQNEQLSSETLPGDVPGFVIFDLQEEALKYIELLLSCGRDTLLELDRLQKVEYPDDAETKKSLPHLVQCFRREIVEVEIDLKDQGKTTIKAVTFVWNENSFPLERSWEPESFIRTPSFRHWSDGDSDWVQEEGALSRTLQINYVWLGDELADAALKSDIEGCKDLLYNNVDPSAPCHIYGSPLQAAVTVGDVRITKLLLREGASPSTRGGKYRSALIAAAVHGRGDLVKLLLDHKADVNVDGGHYVSALYQAVKQSHAEMGYALLESGAWVNTKDYLELFDLAAEHQDRDMEELLIAYDVKQLHKSLPLFTRPSVFDKIQGTSSKENHKIVKQSKKDIVFATFGAIFQQRRNQNGRWTGIKGVRVLRTAIDAGLSPEIVDKIGPYLDPIEKVIDYIESALSDTPSGSIGSSIVRGLGKLKSKSDGGYSSDSNQESDEDDRSRRDGPKIVVPLTSHAHKGYSDLPSRSRSSDPPNKNQHSKNAQPPYIPHNSYINTTNIPPPKRSKESPAKTTRFENFSPPPAYSRSQYLEIPSLQRRHSGSTPQSHQRSRSFGEFDKKTPDAPRKRASSDSRPLLRGEKHCEYCNSGWIKEPRSRRGGRDFERQCEVCLGTGFERGVLT